MYQQQAQNQQQQSHLRVTNQVGASNNGMYMSNQAEANRASIQNSNTTQRNQKMMGSGAKSTSKRGFSSELQYKLQLPEIMQQQQTKIN